MFTIKEDVKEKFRELRESNAMDAYGSRIISFAIDWATAMEQRIAAGESMTTAMLEETGNKANYDGISGFMFGAAADILATHWIHGEEFRKIYNNLYEYDGEGVVNPALVTAQLEEK